jgi:hypothetical protein
VEPHIIPSSVGIISKHRNNSSEGNDMKQFLKAILTTTAFALTLGVATASLGVTAAHAGSETDKSEIGGMVCHEGHHSANKCRGWTGEANTWAEVRKK